MVTDARARMIDSAIVLLARHGLAGASFSEVLAASGASRGSIYHHFPGGKDELVASAVDVVVARAVESLQRQSGTPAIDIAYAFVDGWRTLLVRTDFSVGCALAAVTVEVQEGVLREHVANAFDCWRAALSSALIAGGVPPEQGAARAATLLAVCEGAVVMSRATRSIAVFDDVVGVMLRDLEAALPG